MRLEGTGCTREQENFCHKKSDLKRVRYFAEGDDDVRWCYHEER
jgi:hypothetical protein